MRSSAIAEEVILRGLPAVFVGKTSELPWVTERIQSLGFQEILEESTNVLPNSSSDVLILDSYEIPLEDEFIQLSNWLNVVNIFDEFTPEYKSDLRIHPGVTKFSPLDTKTNTLSGPEFVPIRRSITRSKPVSTSSRLEIIVTGGASDPTRFVFEVSKILNKSKSDFHASVFVANGDFLELDERFSKNPIGINLDEAANKSDLAFTTASTTSLEFLARGCAVGIGCAFNNQRQYYRELDSQHLAVPIGEFSNGSWSLDERMIQDLLESETLRASLKSNSDNLIDLNGAKRIVDEILKL